MCLGVARKRAVCVNVRGYLGRDDFFHFRRAVFELGNFAHGVELRVGQQVGGGFGEAERDEHHAVGERR